MEDILKRLGSKKPSSGTSNGNGKTTSVDKKAIQQALSRLADQLEKAIPVLQNANTQQSSDSIKSWLYNLCESVQSGVGTPSLVRAVWEASHLASPEQQQAILFDSFGAESMDLLFDIMSRLPEIKAVPIEQLVDNDVTASDTTTMSNGHFDQQHYERQLLLQEALDSAQVAAIARAEMEALNAPLVAGGVTHTVQRVSNKKMLKDVEKAEKRAQQARKRAQQAGIDISTEMLSINNATLGSGGLAYMSQDEIAMQRATLAPEGSRQFYQQQKLPLGARVEEQGQIRKVIIPPAKIEPGQLHERLKISDILDPASAKAFEGATSLNPMQSAVYEVAFKLRDNVLVCAPTGAGKTNVAMLTVVAHFRDVGLIRGGRTSPLETGKKVVYIAPMKALAQEVVEKFSSKLKSLGLIVRELTGDMQLTRAESDAANVIVTTPEKWDVVTRKAGNEDNALGNQCGLLIIDEVHLLADERGAVIESVVARLHRLVEIRQKQVRIVGLSATLPNYQDVASFLHVQDRGLFYFGPEHRPVPLQQQFIGIGPRQKETAGSKENGNDVKPTNRKRVEDQMNEQCFDIVLDSLKRGYQVMVFVHSRKGTGDTAAVLTELASHEGVLDQFFYTKGKDDANGKAYSRYADRARKSKNRELSNHFENGLGIHHAGMLRNDRKLTEMMFNDGAIKVLCCTATLAWGINLPAHTVIIKGTDVYNPEKGKNVDLSILDVQQIFGRAGRPQFDSSGEATLITSQASLDKYLNKLVRAVPIESNFVKHLHDHLNAEVVGGTVTNLNEAVAWLKYTYLYVRMVKSPLNYGINEKEQQEDPLLSKRCREFILDALKLLRENMMIRYDSGSENVAMTDMGRVAAHYYIQAESIATFMQELVEKRFAVSVTGSNSADESVHTMSDAKLCHIICSAAEFENMKIRQEEMRELQSLVANAVLKIPGTGSDDMGRKLITTPADKAFVLLQAYISKKKMNSFTLSSDMNYIAANAGRVTRAVFEICLKKKWSSLALKLLRIAKSIENRFWWFQTPLRHFDDELSADMISSVESVHAGDGYDGLAKLVSILDMTAGEIEDLYRLNRQKGRNGVRSGVRVQNCVKYFPRVDVTCNIQPTTSDVFRFHVEVTPSFQWHRRWHGSSQLFWLWVENGDSNQILHEERISINSRTFPESIVLDFFVPCFSSRPQQYLVRAISEFWVGSETVLPVSTSNVQMLEDLPYETPLLDLAPLPVSALNNKDYESLFTKVKYFNPVQTQLFHTLYHTSHPVFIGAPTGSGKTIVAELAILRMKLLNPKGICVYIAPLKSLARERLKEWTVRLKPLKWTVLELTGDTHHDQSALGSADILVCTPEKWDLISRGWTTQKSGKKFNGIADRSYIKRVQLLVIDEVHLLGEERGAILEAIVSRTRYISQTRHNGESQKSNNDVDGDTRIVALSTAVANPLDLADWIGIDTKAGSANKFKGLYNFPAASRPVPMSVHVQGYAGRHYCPRMASMNKPCYAAVKDYSPEKPVLIFVASRRQTRLTAFDLISLAASDDPPRKFLKCTDDYIEAVAANVSDEALKHTLVFGIGLHHAGLTNTDRDIVERLYLDGSIQIMVATATLAWGVNLPARLVIVKGTEYFDGKTLRYVDYPLTDVLQMVGRAGRPGFDDKGIAVVMSTLDKKPFYKKFLYAQFPVESCLKERLPENMIAEVSSSTISSVDDAIHYLAWTFYARRVYKNPSYYGAISASQDDVRELLIDVAMNCVDKLKSEGCVEAGDDDTLSATTLGHASTYYYLNHRTPKQMLKGVSGAMKIMRKLSGDESSSQVTNGDGSNGTYGDSTFPVRSFIAPRVSTQSVCSSLLYALSSTHEFDELPVRHNEEHLNRELSELVIWGPEAVTGNSVTNQTKNVPQEVFANPHTKCYLLIQAYIGRATLPISDYVNDTMSVVDNLPRLLAAMRYIATQNYKEADLFDFMTYFSLIKQFITTRSTPDSSPLLILPGINRSNVKKLTSLINQASTDASPIYALRQMSSNQISSILKQCYGKNGPLDKSLSVLRALPLVRVQNIVVTKNLDKVSKKVEGVVTVELEVLREVSKNNRNGQDLTMLILLGSVEHCGLLAETSQRIAANRSTISVRKELKFDWESSKSRDDTKGHKAVARILWDRVCGFDLEFVIDLQNSSK